MEGKVKKAFDKLEAMGVPVKDSTHNGGHFWIDGEVGATQWLDYYGQNKSWGNWTINDKIVDILADCDLYPEWANAGVVAVYDA